MKIDGRLSKLEQRAKGTLRCDWCRYVLHDTPPSTRRKYAANPQSKISVSCSFCGTMYNVNVSDYDEYIREATILYYNQERGAVYRDARVFAAIQWLSHRRTLKRWLAGDLDKEKVEGRQKAREQHRDQQRYEKKKVDRYTREREEVKERALSFFHRMSEEEEKEYAPHAFPLAAELKRIEQPESWIPGTYEQMEFEEITARKVLYSSQVMEACERVLWNTVLPETQAAMLELNSIIQKFEDERAQKAREAEEEKARQEAVLEGERSERLAAIPAPEPSQSQSPMRPLPAWLDNGTLAAQQRRMQNRDKYPYEND